MSILYRRRLAFEPLEDRRLLAIVTVTTPVDKNNFVGLVSLREAVSTANPDDTINFSFTGTINLLSTVGTGHIVVNKNLTIQGPGANLLTIRAADSDGANNSNGRRVFVVDNGSSSFATVTISGLTLTNGDPTISGETDGGGAIQNLENLTLNSCVLSDNFAPNGGAIHNVNGTLTINDSSISSNSASSDGGGVIVQGGSLVLNRTTITDNQATNSGGGILSQSRPVNIADSTISGNFANEDGGGICQQYGGTLTMTGSTISGNAADADHNGGGNGGGIYCSVGTISLTNCTISGNTAVEGGGIFSDTSQTIAIAHSTITRNGVPSSSSGGGIRSVETANLNHTIVAGNLRGGSTANDLSGSFNATYSLIGTTSGASVSNSGGNILSTADAKLAPLANNGGLTLTHALLAGSPAIDAGAVGVAGSGGIPLYDQRGAPYSRVVDFVGVAGTGIDIGAIEMTSGPVLPGDYNLNHAVDAGDYVLWRKTNNTSVPQYSGADGDGSSFVDSADYTVWRSHFGNSSPAEANAAEAPSDETVGAGAIVAKSGGTAGAALAFAGFVALNDADDGPHRAVVGEAQAVATDTAIELLLVSGGNHSTADNRSGDFESVAKSYAPKPDSSLGQLTEVGGDLLDFWQSI